MSLIAVTPPEVDPVTRDEAKQHCRIDSTKDDAYVDGLIKAATSHVEGRDGSLGRAIVQQQWDLRLRCFSSRIRLPLPPVSSVDEITYLDPDGVQQTLAGAEYRVANVGGADPAWIEPELGLSWPSTRDVSEAVTIRYTAGYEPDTTGAEPDYRANVPTAIKHAMLLMIGHWYENREEVIVGQPAIEIPLGAKALLAPFKTHFFA